MEKNTKDGFKFSYCYADIPVPKTAKLHNKHLKIRKRVSNTNKLKERLKKDVCIETDKCILRRYVKHKRNKKFGQKIKLNMSTAAIRSNIRLLEVGSYNFKNFNHEKEDNTCRSNFAHNSDVKAILIENLMQLLNNYCKKHVLIKTRSNNIESKNSKTSHTTTTFEDIKKSLTTVQSSQRLTPDSSFLTIPILLKKIRIISTLSIPRYFGIKKKARYKRRSNTKRLPKNYTNIFKAHILSMLCSSVEFIAMPTKSYVKYKMTATKNKTKFKSHKSESEIDLVPTLLKSIYRGTSRNNSSEVKIIKINTTNTDSINVSDKSIQLTREHSVCTRTEISETLADYDNDVTKVDTNNKNNNSNNTVNNFNISEKILSKTNKINKPKHLKKNSKIKHPKSAINIKDKHKFSRSPKNPHKITNNVKSYNRKKIKLKNNNIMNDCIYGMLDHYSKRKQNTVVHIHVNNVHHQKRNHKRRLNVKLKPNNKPKNPNILSTKINKGSDNELRGTQHQVLTTEEKYEVCSKSQNPVIVPILDGALSHNRYIYNENTNAFQNSRVQKENSTLSLNLSDELDYLQNILKEITSTAVKLIRNYVVNYNKAEHIETPFNLENTVCKQDIDIRKIFQDKLHSSDSCVKCSKSTQKMEKSQIVSGLKLKKSTATANEMKEVVKSTCKTETSSYQIIDSETLIKITDMTSAAVNELLPKGPLVLPSPSPAADHLHNIDNNNQETQIIGQFSKKRGETIITLHGSEIKSDAHPKFKKDLNIVCQPCAIHEKANAYISPGHTGQCDSTIDLEQYPTACKFNKKPMSKMLGIILCFLCWLPLLIICYILYANFTKPNNFLGNKGFKYIISDKVTVKRKLNIPGINIADLGF